MSPDSALIEPALERFGLREFRPGQREVIDAVVGGRPTIAVLPTGAGKSLCYQLPAVALGGLTVVVSPLISLMKDQVDALAARGIPATFVNSTIEAGERESRLQAAVRGSVRLLYVAPERFRLASFVNELERAELTLFAVDEAHCISEWGHDFRPDYARLGEVVARLKPPRLVALTATATPDVREHIGAQLGMREPAVFVRGFDRPNLHFAVRASGGEADKLESVLQLLDEPAARGKPALVYAATRKKTEKLALALRAAGVKAQAYHAGLADEERAAAQERWMADKVRVVVATNAFGMGVDKPDVRLVIHHDLPGSAEAYYQEAGRAGRDGLGARCVLLFNHADVRLREYLIDNGGGEGETRSPERQKAERDRLRLMMSYAYARMCRRRFLLGYFGDPAQPPAGERCGACDQCAGESGGGELSDDEHLTVRKVLATVARVDGWFGRNRIALALEGSTAKELTGTGLERLSTFGVLRGKPHAFVLDLLGALEAADLLASASGDYPTLRITPNGREVMHDRQRARLPFPSDRTGKSARGRARKPAAITDEAAGPIDQELYEKLRALRARLAKDERLPAYCVFHDRTLAELTRARPRNLDELGRVSGVGPLKLAKYGSAFLEAVRPEG